MQLEPLLPRGSDSSDTSEPRDNVNKSRRNPQQEAKMVVDQPQRQRPPPLDLRQSQEIHDPEKLSGPQFSELTATGTSSQGWKKTPDQPAKKRRKRGRFWRWLSGCFIGDEQLTDGEHKVKMESPKVDQRPIMGKFSSLFRSKSDKDKADETNVNPYAQQPSNDTYSTAPSYSGHREAPSGLPSGPHPGGLPSGPRPGSAAPPPYTSQNDAAFADNKKRYDSATSSPSIGYGNERHGAPTGYGSNRYDNAAGYGQNNNFQPPPQRQGGYGGLDRREELFNGYGSEPQSRPNAQPAIPDNFEDMTQEEKDDFEAETKRGEIIHTIRETAQSSARARMRAAEGVEKMVAMHEMYDRDEAILNKVEQQLDESKHQARMANAHLDNLDAANSSLFNLTANSRGKLAERSARKAQSERERELDRDALREAEAARKRELKAATAQSGRQTLGLHKADPSKYTFEDHDGEQQELNDQIDDDLTEIERNVSTINMLAKGFLVRTDASINQLGGLVEKSDATRGKIRQQDDRVNARYLG